MEKIPVKEMIIKNKAKAVFAISLVEFPAIEEDFIALNSMAIKLATVDADKRILMGAALVPDKNIYREDKDGNPFYIFFSKDTIKESAELYLKNYRQAETTVEHQVGVDGVTLVESWLVEDTTHDKSAIYNLKLPVGTWMVSLKVDNDEIWNDYIKTGKLKGFSIEGAFSESEQLSKQVKLDKMSKPSLKDSLISFLTDWGNGEVKLAEFGTEDGAVVLVADAIEVGQPIFIKGEDDAEDIPAPDGEYVLEDMRKVMVKDGMVETVSESEPTAEELEAQKLAEEKEAATKLAAEKSAKSQAEKMDSILTLLKEQKEVVHLSADDVNKIVAEQLKGLPIKLAKVGAPIEVKVKEISERELSLMSMEEKVKYHNSKIK